MFSKKTGSRLLFNVDDLVVLPYNIADYRLFHTKVELTKYWYLQLMKKKCATCHNGYRFYLYRKFQDTNKYTILSQEAILDAVNQITGIFNVILVGIASISLVVGGIGIMNIMLVTVKERTREIGIKWLLAQVEKESF